MNVQNSENMCPLSWLLSLMGIGLKSGLRHQLGKWFLHTETKERKKKLSRTCPCCQLTILLILSHNSNWASKCRGSTVQLSIVTTPVMIQMAIVQDITSFIFPRKWWGNLTKRQHVQDSSSVKSLTVVCSDHFKREDIIRKLSGCWDLKKGWVLFLHSKDHPFIIFPLLICDWHPVSHFFLHFIILIHFASKHKRKSNHNRP